MRIAVGGKHVGKREQGVCAKTLIGFPCAACRREAFGHAVRATLPTRARHSRLPRLGGFPTLFDPMQAGLPYFFTMNYFSGLCTFIHEGGIYTLCLYLSRARVLGHSSILCHLWYPILSCCILCCAVIEAVNACIN
jgi:hypothetical protein